MAFESSAFGCGEFAPGGASGLENRRQGNLWGSAPQLSAMDVGPAGRWGFSDKEDMLGSTPRASTGP